MNSSHHQASPLTIYTRPITSSLPENSSTLLLQFKILFVGRLTLKMKAIWPFETSKTISRATQFHIPEDESSCYKLYLCLILSHSRHAVTFHERSAQLHNCTICSCRFKIRIACKLKTNVSLNFVNFLEQYTEDAMRLRVSIKQGSLMS
jgi:hypothetical protein